MKNLLKKYLLATAGDPFMYGYLIIFGFLGLIIIALVVMGSEIIKNGIQALIVVAVGFVLAIAVGIVQKFVSNKYLTHISQWPYDVRKVILKVENGRVVDFGKGFWGKQGYILMAAANSRRVDCITELTREIHGTTVKIKVSLIVRWDMNQDIKLCYGFIPQQIYDLYLHYGSQLIENGVSAAFELALSESPVIRSAMDKYYDQPFALIQAVQTALPMIKFQHPLSNIQSVQASLDTNSILEPVMFMRAGNPG